MGKKVKLYTCKYGIDNWRNGLSFLAWTEEERETESNDVENDISFIVDERYVIDDNLMVTSDAKLEILD